MAYIGKTPVNGFHSKQTISTDGSTTTFALNHTVADETSIIVSVGGVLQEPKEAYNLSGGGTNIVFTAAPSTASTTYIHYLGQAIVQNLLDVNGAEFVLDADADTSFTADTDDEIDIKVGGSDRSTIKATGFHNLDNIKFVAGTGDDLEIYHDGTNSYVANKTGALKIATETSGIAVTIGHTTSEVTVADNMTVTGNLTIGGTTNFGDFDISNVGSIALDTITNDGTDITLDSSGDIILDAAGNDIFLKAGGTTFGSITNVSTHVVIKDGTTTAATFNGANVTFAGTIGSGNITSTGTVQGTTITATTAFVPDASDGAALGTTALEFSDLFLADGAVISLGDDDDVTLTHVADTGVLLNAASVIQFRDSAINIGSPADGDLDINADDEIELNSTLIDINGNVEISGTAVTTGVHTFTAVPVFPNDTIETADIQADAITGAKIADNAINSEHYTDGSIDTAHIADSNITTAKIADANITTAKLSTALLTGATDIGAGIADADLILLDDGAGGTLRKSAASRIKTYIADVTLTTAAQTNITSLGTLTALTVDDVAVDGKVITMTGSTDDTAVFTVAANGALTLETTDTAAAAANIQITADGTAELAGTTVTLDSSGDIELDAGGNDFKFSSGGTQVLNIANSSSDVIIKPVVDAKDLIFQQRDGTEVFRVEDGAYMSLAATAVNPEATLSDASTVSWNGLTSPVAKVTLGGNRTLGAASGVITGQFLSILFIQDGTGSRTISFNAAYEHTGDVAPVLTTTANKGDLFVYRYNGSKFLEVGRNLNLTLS
jgi:hypothetical protein